MSDLALLWFCLFTGVAVFVGVFLLIRFWQWKKEARRLGLGGEGE